MGAGIFLCTALVAQLTAAQGEYPCDKAPFKRYAYCNASLDLVTRVADLVSRINITEASTILNCANTGIPRLGIPPIPCGENLHGAMSRCGGTYDFPGYTSTGCPTSLPHALLAGASLNRTLFGLYGGILGQESRALFNQNATRGTGQGSGGALVVFTPNINPARDPRWGRGQEVAGEDPFLVGEYAAAFVANFQTGASLVPGGNSPDPRHLQALATTKHATAYDCDFTPNVTDPSGPPICMRSNFSAVVSLKDYVEYFIPPFRAAVQRGKPASIMCSVNAVNGVPACADGAFLTTIAREQFGFSGYVVTDGNALSTIFSHYHYAANFTDSLAKALHAGVDYELGSVLPRWLPTAIANEEVTPSDVAQSLTRFFSQWFRLGLLDPPADVTYNAYGPAQVDTPLARAIAYESAVQGIVLLQNNVSKVSPNGANAPLLPLPVAGMKSIALIGPNANEASVLLSNYAGVNTLVNNQTVLMGIQRMLQGGSTNVIFQAGCLDIFCNVTTGFAAAVSAAASADVAIMVMGLSGDIEGESLDRLSTTLPGSQETLIQQVAATGTPVIVVLVNGGSISCDWTAANIPAIVEAFYPGEFGGDAVAAILFGASSPSGRLPYTMYPSSFQDTRTIANLNLTDAEGITYWYYTGQPLFPFGWGLSYTTFTYTFITDVSTPLRVSTSRILVGAAASPPPFAVNITNTGTVTSDVSVPAFFSSGAAGEPLQQMFDFQRVSQLAPGQSVTVFFSLPPALILARADSAGTLTVQPGVYSVIIGGPEAPHARLHAVLEVTGVPATVFSLHV